MPAFYMEATIATLNPESVRKLADRFAYVAMGKAIRAFLQATLARIPTRTGFLRGAFSELSDVYLKGAQLNPGLAALFNDKEAFRQAEKDRDKKLSSKGLEVRQQKFKEEIAAGRKRGHRTTVYPGAGVTKGRTAFQSYQEKAKEHESKIRGVYGGKPEYYYDGKIKIIKTLRGGVQFATPLKDVLKTGSKGVGSLVFFFDVAISYYRVNDFFSRIRGAPWKSLEAGRNAMIEELQRQAAKFPRLESIMGHTRIVLKGSKLTAQITDIGPEQVTNTRAYRLLDLEGPG